MKNPNGYGNIRKLSGNRRKPWQVRISTKVRGDDGLLRLKQKPIGYYVTRKDAMQALAEYNADPYDLSSIMTFSEIYAKVKKVKHEKKGKATQASMSAAFKHCEPISMMQIKDLRTVDYQRVFDGVEGKSRSTQNNIMILINDVYSYCEASGIRLVNYAQYVERKASKKKQKGAFTLDEVNRIWKSDSDLKDLIITLIYTGMRIGELLNLTPDDIRSEGGIRYIRLQGTKTDAANRLVPIHEKIAPIIADRLSRNYLFDHGGRRLSYRTLRYRFDTYMKQLNICKTPHECRHTFSTFAKRSGMDDVARKMILGHAIKDITDGVYTHLDVADLKGEMDKLTIL